MRLTAKAEYALRALLTLAACAPDVVKLETLIAEEGMPRKFLESILSELRRAGLVHSRRGADGGYGLAVPPEKVSVGAVIRVVNGPFAEPPPCRVAPSRPSQALAEVFAAVSVSVSAVLDQTTLAHLLSGELPEHVERLARGDLLGVTVPQKVVTGG